MNNRGLTFLEIIIALVILTVGMVGFLQASNTALEASYRATREITGTNLAGGLLAEIMAKNFVDPNYPTETQLGADPIGAATESRFGGGGNTPYNDVDDYVSYPTENPPISIANLPMNGTAGMPNCSDFTRSVNVIYVDFAGGTYNENPGVATNYKKVSVTVSGPYVKDIVAFEYKRNPNQ